VAPATAAKVGSGRPNAAAPSTTRRRFEQPFDAVRAPGFGRGHRLVPTIEFIAPIDRWDASQALARQFEQAIQPLG